MRQHCFIKIFIDQHVFNTIKPRAYNPSVRSLGGVLVSRRPQEASRLHETHDFIENRALVLARARFDVRGLLVGGPSTPLGPRRISRREALTTLELLWALL